MKKTIILGLAVALATSISGMAFAQEAGGDAQRGPGKHGGGFARLKKLDTDNDGNVTKEEFGAGAAAKFNELDADGNGSVSLGEFSAGGPGAKAFEHLDRNGDGVINKEDRPAKPERVKGAKPAQGEGGPEEGGPADDDHAEAAPSGGGFGGMAVAIASVGGGLVGDVAIEGTSGGGLVGGLNASGSAGVGSAGVLPSGGSAAGEKAPADKA